MFLSILLVTVYFSQAAIATTADDCIGIFPWNNDFLFSFQDKCYYFYLNKRLDYSDARDRCQETEGTLAVVKSKEINSFLHRTLAYTLSEYMDKNYWNFWIGLSDAEKEGHFRWVDGEPMKYENFATLQGTRGFYLKGLLEDCVAMNPTSGQWYDYKCESSYIFIDARRPFICEYDAKKRGTTPNPTKLPEETTQQVTKARDTTLKMTQKPEKNTEQKTKPTDIVVFKENNTLSEACPEVMCKQDCGMNGYLTDIETGCLICSCNIP